MKVKFSAFGGVRTMTVGKGGWVDSELNLHLKPEEE